MSALVTSKPATGKLLIAEPFMSDAYFHRTVVLLTEHGSDGSIGFILNKETNIKVYDVLNGFPQCDIPLYFGGPVQTDTVHFLHTLGDSLEGSKEILKGIYWGGNLEQLKYMVEKGLVTQADIKFFAGYSGWSPNQVKEEIKKHTWLLYECSKQFAFKEESHKLWGTVLKTMGNPYAMMAIFPIDPSLN